MLRHCEDVTTWSYFNLPQVLCDSVQSELEKPGCVTNKEDKNRIISEVQLLRLLNDSLFHRIMEAWPINACRTCWCVRGTNDAVCTSGLGFGWKVSYMILSCLPLFIHSFFFKILFIGTTLTAQSSVALFAFAPPPPGIKMLSVSVCLQLVYHLGPPWLKRCHRPDPCDTYSKQHVEAALLGHHHQGKQGRKHLISPLLSMLKACYCLLLCAGHGAKLKPLIQT